MWRQKVLRSKRSAALFVAICCSSATLGAPLGAQAKLAAATKDSAAVVYDDDGVRIHSADGRRQLKLRGYVALDGRFISSDRTDALPNTFAVRRARLIFDLNINPWMALRVMPDLAVTTMPGLADAFVDVTLGKHLWMRAGKQKVAYGWERYINASDQPFPERSIVSQLSSNRDEGVAFTGDVMDGRVEATVAMYNGVPNGGANGESDVNDAKDVTVRVVTRPIVQKNGQGVILGYSGSHGVMRAAGTATGLAHYATPAAATFFQYRETAGAVADGDRDRHNLFAVARFGSFGAFAEGYRTLENVGRGVLKALVPSTGAFLALDWVMTGELSDARGIAPAKVFDPEHGNWGALQLVARVAQVSVGDAAFPVFADSVVSARSATEQALGLSWYLTRNTKAQAAYELTTFRGGAATGNRPTEQLLYLRLQTFF
ncbi:MAG: porin [bacterium]